MGAALPFAAAALPGLISLLTPKPGMPGMNPAANVKLPDVSNYYNSMLQSGFNPNSQLYDIARQGAMASINGDLANKGMLFSSAGNESMNSAMAKIANDFLSSELQRRISSFNAATGYNLGAANVQMNAGNAANQSNWNGYNAALGNRQNDINAVGSIAGAGAGYMNNNNMMNYMNGVQGQNQNNFNTYMSYLQGQQAPSGGSYSMTPPGTGYLGVNTNFGPPAY